MRDKCHKVLLDLLRGEPGFTLSETGVYKIYLLVPLCTVIIRCNRKSITLEMRAGGIVHRERVPYEEGAKELIENPVQTFSEWFYRASIGFALESGSESLKMLGR